MAAMNVDFITIALIVFGIISVIAITSLIVAITTLCKLKTVKRQYDRFTRGKDAESLEDTILEYLDRIDGLEKLLGISREEIISLRKNQKNTFQKIGIVKYDAFFDLSGKLSYVVVLLDQKDNGFVLNSVYNRDGSYSYLKEIQDGKCDIELSKEEIQALKQAQKKA